MASHNSLATKGYTVAYWPWKVIHLEYFQSKTEALIREKALKSGKGREYIKNEIIPFMKEVGFISAQAEVSSPPLEDPLPSEADSI